MAKRKIFRQAAKGSDWTSAAPRVSGRERLTQELTGYREQLAFRLRLVAGASGGFSGRLITYGEMLSDFSRRPLGRFLTATVFLTLAYILIPR
jgi:hypothetical protein